MTAEPAPIFGVFVPQGWKLEFAGVPDPREQWRLAVDVAVRAEALGFDSIWVYDHFHNVPKPSHESVFECWTTMAAISQRTTTIRLGQMVGCNLYRPPALLAKITSTLDVISGGRLDWGIGAGWYENECRGYGYPFPVPKGRIAMRVPRRTPVRRHATDAADPTGHAGRSSHIGHQRGTRGKSWPASRCAIWVEGSMRPAATASAGSHWPRSSRASSASESLR